MTYTEWDQVPVAPGSVMLASSFVCQDGKLMNERFGLLVRDHYSDEAIAHWHATKRAQSMRVGHYASMAWSLMYCAREFRYRQLPRELDNILYPLMGMAYALNELDSRDDYAVGFSAVERAFELYKIDIYT